MKTPRRLFLALHRRQRLVLWALAMLAWVASVFAGVAPTRRHLHQRGDISLDGLARFVKRLILVRAADLAGGRPDAQPRFFKRGRDLRRRHLLRSVVGSKLRRALAHRDPIARISILIHTLTHLDAWAARFATRLRRKLTRLFPIAPTQVAEAIFLGPPASSPACPDSS